MSRRCAACSIPSVPAATVAGLDLVRDAAGELLVLEDNLRMPSGATYALAVREAVAPELGAAHCAAASSSGYASLLGAAIAAAAPADVAEPAAAILSDGAESGTYYEHRRFSRELAIPIVTPRQLELSRGRLYRRQGRRREQVQVVYRRTDEDRLRGPDGALTALSGELLLPALRAGSLSVCQRLRHRPGRRQADLPSTWSRDGALLPRRGAAAAVRASYDLSTRHARKRRSAASTNW